MGSIPIGDLCSYLLRATFNAPDQGYADGQVLDTPAEGVEDGSLTVKEAAGTVAAVSNRAQIIGANSYYNTGVYDPTGQTRSLGLALLASVECHASENGMVLGWNDSAAVGWMPEFDYSYRMFNSGGLIHLRFYNASAWRDVATAAVGTAYEHAFVLGGYDASGVPWYSGAGGTYDYGCGVYIKGGAFTAWTLLWKTNTENTATLYPEGSAYGGGTNYIDNFRVPDRDLSAVLQPTAFSTFDAANGTSLDAITPEVGGAWTENDGTWEIQGNRARLDADTPNRDAATVDSGLSDCMVDCIVNPVASWAGIAVRYVDDDNHWSVVPLTTDNTLYLYEINAGGATLRASAVTGGIAASTDYDIRAILDGQTIDVFMDGGNKISYALASFQETETKHGIRGDQLGNTYDNFAVYPRTSAVFDSELDAC